MQTTDKLKAAERLSACLVTEEFAGLTPSGGIGACARGLAMRLAQDGWAVTVLITADNISSSRNENAHSMYRVELLREFMRRENYQDPIGDVPAKSFFAYQYIRRNGFSVVHFNDWLGTGFYTVVAKTERLIDACIVTHLHGSSEWVRLHNLSIPTLDALEVEAMERFQIEHSDLAISPSQYLLDWYAARGVKPPRSYVRNWMLPQWFSSPPRETAFKTRPLAPNFDRLIFFGRHERRKGFELFVDAVRELPASCQPHVIFLGRFDQLDREFTGSYALRKLKDYAGAITFISDMDQSEACQFISGGNSSLCVMPSIIENSPCVVGECLTMGVPFLASDVGGTAELIDKTSREHCLFAPTPASLADAIERAFREGLPAIDSVLAPARIFAEWGRDNPELRKSKPRKYDERRPPLVSICVTHFERPILLKRALTYIARQTYKNIEVIVVDDGSSSKEAKAALDLVEKEPYAFPIRVFRTTNRYLGAARNFAVKHAKGQYILFHDDDNVAREDEVETFVRVAIESSADILTAFCFTMYGDDEPNDANRNVQYFPLGIGGAFSFYRNRFGDANAFFKMSAFRALGGFSELRNVGWEDWEIFLKAYIKNMRMFVIPEPLFYYRVSESGMLGSTSTLRNRERIFTAVDELKPRVGADVLRIAQSEALSQEVLDRAWETVSDEPGAELHQNLMAENPNSERAARLLFDLGRVLGREHGLIKQSLAQVKTESESTARKGPVWLVGSLEPTDSVSHAYVEGWVIGKVQKPVKLSTVRTNGTRMELIDHVVVFRRDIVEKYATEPDGAFGFSAVYAAIPGLTAAKRRPALGERLRQKSFRLPVTNLDAAHATFEAMTDSPQIVGHIDKLLFLGESWLDLPNETGWKRIEIEASQGVSAGKVIYDGRVLDGRKIGQRRYRFSVELRGAENDGLKVLTPVGVTSDFIIY